MTAISRSRHGVAVRLAYDPGMRNSRAWKALVGRILGKSTVQPVKSPACCVSDCSSGPLLVVAGDASGEAWMCTRHAQAWSGSDLCRDVAQHNSGASLGSLSAWIDFSNSSEAY